MTSLGGARRHLGGVAVALAVASVGGLAGCDSDTNAPMKPPTTAASTGLAILSSDYKSTSVALYDPATGTLTDDCMHTGQTSLTEDLSGDVALPSAPQATGELVVIDAGSSVLTFIDPATCVPRVQISVTTGGFMANPRDIVTLSAHKAYVTRYETNAAPSADPAAFDGGDDILIIDPAPAAGASPVLGRIPLTGYATAVAGATIQARPDRAVLANGLVYVTLDSISALFDATGPGRVVVIDPATDSVVRTIDLPEQKDCVALSYVAATHRLYVSCGGAFGDANQIAESAVVEIDLSGATPTLGRKIAATELGDGTQGLNFSFAAVLGQQAFVGTLGTFPDATTGALGSSDALYVVPLAGGTATKVLDGGAYNLGAAVADATAHMIYLPDGDATLPRVRVFDASGATPVASTPFEANPHGHLPPRHIAWY